MYKDLISYELADGITEDHLLHIALKIIKSWMSKQPGFIKWEIAKNENGSYTDIVTWESQEFAKMAESQMVHIPNAQEWFACYNNGSINNTPLNVIFSSTNFKK